jgi:hypothetical protein
MTSFGLLLWALLIYLYPFINIFLITNLFLPCGSKQELFSKRAAVLLLAITDQYPFSIIFPNYLNLLFITKFLIILSLKLVPINTASLNLILPSPNCQLISNFFPFNRFSQTSWCHFFNLSNTFDLSHILCFCINLVLLGFLVAIYTDFAITFPTENLRSAFMVFFPGLLKYFPFFLRDLFSDPRPPIYSLTTYVMHLSSLGYLLSAGDIKIQPAVKSPENCNSLRSDINST